MNQSQDDINTSARIPLIFQLLVFFSAKDILLIMIASGPAKLTRNMSRSDIFGIADHGSALAGTFGLLVLLGLSNDAVRNLIPKIVRKFARAILIMCLSTQTLIFFNNSLLDWNIHSYNELIFLSGVISLFGVGYLLKSSRAKACLAQFCRDV